MARPESHPRPTVTDADRRRHGPRRASGRSDAGTIANEPGGNANISVSMSRPRPGEGTKPDEVHPTNPFFYKYIRFDPQVLSAATLATGPLTRQRRAGTRQRIYP